MAAMRRLHGITPTALAIIIAFPLLLAYAQVGPDSPDHWLSLHQS